MRHGRENGHYHPAAEPYASHPALSETSFEGSSEGYVFKPASKTVRPEGGVFRFGIRGPDGALVRRFVMRHERELHLIVVSRDLNSYAHLHPERDTLGNWSVHLPELEPGAYRAYADLQPAGGPELVLSADLTVTGRVRDRPRPTVSRFSRVGGFDVGLAGMLETRGPSRLTFHVVRDGEPADLEPYLGAMAHLVAIRAADGAFLHVHPAHDQSRRGEVSFDVHAPAPGRYRLFLDLKVDGRVDTAAFMLDAA